MSRPLAAGERVLLFDNKGRRYLVTLAVGGEFHTHAGPIDHDDLIGRDEGTRVRSRRGARYIAVRPTLAEVVLKMPRGAQVIYPKDLGPILIQADVFPGARVLESGLGSGALSMTLLRAGADISGYEIRPDFAARAQANVAGFLGEEVLDRYDVKIRDVYDGIEERDLDRVILDLPEPWRVVKHAGTALRPGGILLSYLPTITQAVALREAMAEHGFGMAETVEVLERSWHIEGQSVRPDHRMVAHTGFLTSGRLLPLNDLGPMSRDADAELATLEETSDTEADEAGAAVNLFDLVIMALAVLAGIGGYRIGFLTRVMSWIGLALGLYLAARFLSRILDAVDLSQPEQRLIAAVIVLLGGAFAGQAVGFVIGGHLLGVLPLGPLRVVDRVVGAVVGAFGVFVALWLLLPAISSVSGLPARETRGSVISRYISTLHGPPGALEALRRLVGEQTFPDVFAALGDGGSPGPAPATTSLSPTVTSGVAASTVQVQGQACDRIQDGSGFAVGPNLVLTNAHVVAGEPRGQTEVILPSGAALPATVIRFDPDRDLALLSVPDLGETPLSIGTASVGTEGAVFGHPGGQTALAITPARISADVNAVGRDLYDQHTTSRDVFILASDLAPGDSGGAMVTPAGQVAGVAFAIDPEQPGTSYALSYKVVDSFLAPAVTSAQAVSTDSCLTD